MADRDAVACRWGGLFKDYYLPRQQLMLDCALDAAHRAVANSSRIDMDLFASNFTRLTLAKETAWGSSTDGSFPTKATGDTFEIAKRLRKEYGGLVDGKGWCEIRNEGGNNYRPDKLGVTNFFVLESVLPELEATWATERAYSSVLRCV